MWHKQEEFAKALGVSFVTVNRWENGKVEPGLKAIKKIDAFCARYDVMGELDD